MLLLEQVERTYYQEHAGGVRTDEARWLRLPVLTVCQRRGALEHNHRIETIHKSICLPLLPAAQRIAIVFSPNPHVMSQKPGASGRRPGAIGIVSISSCQSF